MNKLLLLSLLLPISFSLQAISPASIAKLGGAAVAGVISVCCKKASDAIYEDGKKNGYKDLGALYSAPYALMSLASGICAIYTFQSAFDYELQSPLKNIRIK